MHHASKKQAAEQRVSSFRFSPARISKGDLSRRIPDREIFYLTTIFRNPLESWFLLSEINQENLRKIYE
jgi:hypothetical protein